MGKRRVLFAVVLLLAFSFGGVYQEKQITKKTPEEIVGEEFNRLREALGTWEAGTRLWLISGRDDLEKAVAENDVLAGLLNLRGPSGLLAVARDTLHAVTINTLLCLPSPWALSPEMAELHDACVAGGLYLAIIQWIDDSSRELGYVSPGVKVVLGGADTPERLLHQRSRYFAQEDWNWDWGNPDLIPLGTLVELTLGDTNLWNEYCDHYSVEFRTDEELVRYFQSQGLAGLLEHLRVNFWAQATTTKDGIEKLLNNYGTEYKNRFACRYFRERLASRLHDYYVGQYKLVRKKAVDAVQRARDKIGDVRIRLDAPVEFVDPTGKPLAGDPPETVLSLNTSEMPQPVGTAAVKQKSVTFEWPLEDFIAAMYFSQGRLSLSARGTGRDSGVSLRVKMKELDFNRGRTGFGGRFYYLANTENRITTILLEPLAVVVESVLVEVQVVGQDGRPAPGSGVLDPTGQVVKADDRGLAKIDVPTSRNSQVGLLDESGNPTGDSVPVNSQDRNLRGLKKVLKVMSSNRPPPVPARPRFDFSIMEAMIVEAQGLFRQAKLSYAEAFSRILGALRAAADHRAATDTLWTIYEAAFRRSKIKPDATGEERARIEETLIRERASLSAQATAWEKRQGQLVQEMEKTRGQAMDRLEVLALTVLEASRALEERTARAQAVIGRLGGASALIAKYEGPTRFRTLAEVEEARQKIAAARNEVQRSVSNLKSELPGLRTADRGLITDLERYEVELASAATDTQAGPALKTPASRVKLTAAGAYWNAKTTADLVQAILDLGHGEQLDRLLEDRDGKLSWLQLRSLSQVNLMNEYDGLLKNPPAPAEQARRLNEKLGAEVYRPLVLLNNFLKEFADEKERNNGFGVDAWEQLRQAEKAFPALEPAIKPLVGRAEGDTGWLAQVETGRKKIADELEAVRKGGWIVEEVEQALVKRTPVDETERLMRNLVGTYRSTERLFAEAREAWGKSLLAGRVDWDAMLSDNGKRYDLLQQAKAALEAGDLARSRKLQDESAALFRPYQGINVRTSGVVGIPAPESLIALKRVRELATWVGAEIAKRTAEQEKRLEASLRFDVTTVGSARADKALLTVRSASGDVAHQGGLGDIKLQPGKYRVSVAGTGVLAAPETQEVTLAAGDSVTVKVTLRAAAGGGGTGTPGPPAAGAFDFSSPGLLTLATNLGIPDFPGPVWSPDSRWIICAASTSDGGLLRVDAAGGRAGQVITAAPDVVPAGGVQIVGGGPGKSASDPVVLGDRVIYRIPVDLGSPGASRLLYEIVPIQGGKPHTAFEFRLGEAALRVKFRRARLLAARITKEPEALLAGEANDGQEGLFVMRGEILDPEKAELLVPLPGAMKVRAVSADWSTVAVNEGDPMAGPVPAAWRILRLPNVPAASLPESDGLSQLCCSPGGTHAAGIRIRGGRPEVVAFPVDRPGDVSVLAKGAINYGEPSWSPDGRFLVVRCFAGHEDERLLRIQVAK